jgi:hypothetical protein
VGFSPAPILDFPAVVCDNLSLLSHIVNRRPRLGVDVRADANTYLIAVSIPEWRAMPAQEKEKEDFSDEELEQIIDMHAPKGQISVAELRRAIRENPLLVAGLVFTFGLLLGVSLRSGRKR